MNKSRLDFLVRMNKSKSLIDRYKGIFIKAGFDESDLISLNLEESDKILEKIKQVFPAVSVQFEILQGNSSYADSSLLTSAFDQIGKEGECYMFSDDVTYCGMYIIKASLVQAKCLNVAKYGYTNTCFIVEKDFKFSFTINFYDEEDQELKDMFDIQLKLI